MGVRLWAIVAVLIISVSLGANLSRVSEAAPPRAEPTATVPAVVPTETPPSFFAGILSVECGAGTSLAVHIRIVNGAGIRSYAIWSTWGAPGQVERVFSDPLPTIVDVTENYDEGATDTVDRKHQIGLVVERADIADRSFTFAFEPNGRCPGHSVAPTATPATGGAITGAVTQADGKAIEGACVHANDHASGAYIGKACTAAGGTFAFGDLPGGQVTLYVDAGAQGYARKIYKDRTAWPGNPVSVIPGQTTSGIDFVLVPGGAITGTITQPDGFTPYSQACFSTIDWATGGGMWSVCNASDGTFVMDGLPAGDYLLRLFNREDKGDLYPDYEYYDGVTASSEATKVTVQASQDTHITWKLASPALVPTPSATQTPTPITTSTPLPPTPTKTPAPPPVAVPSAEAWALIGGALTLGVLVLWTGWTRSKSG